MIRIIAGNHKGKKLLSTRSHSLRPSTSMIRETIFNICQDHIEGALFLDLFAGIGAVGLEAVSRGAKEVFFVEYEKKHIQVIRDNITLLKEEDHCHVLGQDVFKVLGYLQKRGFTFDIIFADPPYGNKEKSLSNEVLQFIDETSLLKEGGDLFLEDHKDASRYAGKLTNLVEKKSRAIGPVLLRHFIRHSEQDKGAL